MHIARDKNGTLGIFTEEPTRDEEYGVFVTSKGDCEILEHVDFPEVTWENSPIEIYLSIDAKKPQ